MHVVKPLQPTDRRIDRAKWHKPLVSIVVTHFNYTDHVMDCLLSIIDQTYENWECVVVDDVSDSGHVLALETIIHQIGHPRIKLHLMEENVGQIPAFFAGLDVTTGEFVCPLDPDDRYAEDFLERMVRAHHDPVLYVPIVSCDEMFLAGDAVLTGCYTSHKRQLFDAWANDATNTAPEPDVTDVVLHFPATKRGWHWSSTSAMMFRRRALRFLRPHKKLAYKRCLDSYLAHGAHLLGGTIFLTKPLVYRGVHKTNAYLTDAVMAMGQDLKRPEREQQGPQALADVKEAIIANGAGGELTLGPDRKRNMAQRLRRSLQKRLDRLAAVLMAKGREA